MDMNEEELEKYCQFIRVITGRIEEHFQDQQEYIHCKEGCALCCKNGEYPCSEKEYEFIKIGFMSVPEETQKIIIEKIVKIQEDKKNFKGEKFIYECPFLINDRCSIYRFRMIICRTFGLAYYEHKENEKDTIKIPFCMNEGLNYSDVFDKDSNTLTSEKFKTMGYKKEPIAFNLGPEDLKTKFGKEIMNIDFGEEKTLLDWLIQ